LLEGNHAKVSRKKATREKEGIVQQVVLPGSVAVPTGADRCLSSMPAVAAKPVGRRRKIGRWTEAQCVPRRR